jgi:hypothetical protein
MIDVFLRYYPQSELRRYLALAVIARLAQIQGIHVTKILGGEFPGYHRTSKIDAETLARSEIYCVMDDDQLPLRDNFFSLAVAELEAHPEYGMLAGFPMEYGLAGQPYALRTERVVEAHSIGCPYFVRKGTLKHFPDSPIHMYDGDLSKVVTDQGLKTGFARYAIYNHLGYGFSQVEKL